MTTTSAVPPAEGKPAAETFWPHGWWKMMEFRIGIIPLPTFGWWKMMEFRIGIIPLPSALTRTDPGVLTRI